MSEILTLPLETILHILSHFDDVINHINVSSALNRQELHEDYQYYPYRKKTKIAIKYRKIKNIKEISDLDYVYDMLINKKKNTYSLYLSGCKYINDVSTLGNVHTLNLSGCEKVSDVSALGNIHTLDLSHTNVIDVSMLGNVHTLDLSDTNVSDVSALGNVYKLDLSRTNINDVSELGNVHTLYLWDCENVMDYSMLKNKKLYY
jgi:hypothetical protein